MNRPAFLCPQTEEVVVETMPKQVSDEEVVAGYRVEKEIENAIAARAKKEGEPRFGASAANLRDREERERKEHERSQNRADWADYFEHQRRAHLQLAVEARRKAREMRGAA